MHRTLLHTAVAVVMTLAASTLMSSRVPSPVEVSRNLVQADVAELRTAINALPWAIRQMAHSDAFGAFERAKFAFKRIEAIAWYLDPEYTGTFLNGAPLPKLQHGVPAIEVLEPKGFQILEEALYADTPDEEECVRLAEALTRDLNSYLDRIAATEWNDHHLFEASKLELIRVISLGITGFDTPAREEALYESALALERVASYLKPYAGSEKVHGHLNGATLRLYEAHRKGFKHLDRAVWLRDYALPAHRELVTLQKSLGIEFHEEVHRSTEPFRWNEKELFSAAFLNPFYFTKMSEADWSESKSELGKKLFFDVALSNNKDMSCGTCHLPERAFTDGRPVSTPSGIDQASRGRNTQTLINATYSPSYFWDLRVEKLENQLLHVFHNENEFDIKFEVAMQRLAQDAEYQRLFHEAFGGINSKNFKYQLETALTSYLVTLNDFNSPVDQWLRGERSSLPPSVLRGFNLFMGEAACGTCHFAPTFSGLVPPYFKEMESEVLGVFTAPRSKVLDKDLGRYAGPQTQRAEFYKHSFKTVTVRNVAKTAPYMHNGQYPDLESVVDFYHHGGGAGLGVDVPYQTLPSDSLSLSTQQRKDLIAFMEALSGSVK